MKTKSKNAKGARLTRTKNTKATDTCKATASSGHLVCALEKHSSGPHSTAPRGGKPMQHATWIANDAGQVVVTTFSRGKRQSEWTEAAPPIAATAPDPVIEDTNATFGDAVESVPPDESDDPRPDWLRNQTDERDAEGRDVKPSSLADACEECGREIGEHDGKKCPKTISKERLDIVFSLVAGCADLGVKMDELSSIHHGALRELERTGRITYRSELWFAAELDQPRAGSKPLTLDDEPEDDEPSEAALAMLDQEDAEALTPGEEPLDPPATMHRPPAKSPAATSSPRTPSMTVGPTIACRGKVYPIHPAARIFPTPELQYRALVESIRINGQKLHVELLDEPGNPVIDGCSRLRACEELGIDPFVKVIHVENPYRHVFAVNLDRRHLSESQRAMAAADLANMEFGANQHTRVSGSGDPPQISQAEAAKLAHASPSLTRDAARVKNNAVPEVTQAVREGKLRVGAGVDLSKLQPAKQREILDKVTQGNGEVRSGKVRSLVKQEEKRAVVRKLNEGRVPTIGMTGGDFGVVLSDPAWPYDNSDQHEGSRGHIPYPGQPVEDIVRLHTVDLPARCADDAILFLCVTNAFVPVAVRIAESGGWTWRTMITITKSRTGMGTWPRGRTEHIVILSRGTPTHTLNEITTWLGDREIEMPREHSQKPEELYEAIEKHCGGRRLEMYARQQREGWTPWGAEADGTRKKSRILTATDERAGSAA